MADVMKCVHGPLSPNDPYTIKIELFIINNVMFGLITSGKGIGVSFGRCLSSMQEATDG